MNKKCILSILLMPAFYILNAQKFDTTVKMGDTGYKIFCSNKKADKNVISITPVGFKNYSQNLTFPVAGKINKALIDDFNNDGYPDVVFYFFDENKRIQIYSIASVTNTSCAPIAMPDIFNDAALRNGYQGQDEVSAMGGFLIRKFPVYQTDSLQKTNTITAYRVIEYTAKKDESSSTPDHPVFKFEVFKSYDEKK